MLEWQYDSANLFCGHSQNCSKKNPVAFSNKLQYKKDLFDKQNS